MKKFDGIAIFENRRAVIATMHGKEKIITPLFQNELKIKCEVPKDFNTDKFGTFSGEIERVQNPLETARAKAFSALSITKESIAIASEGSFGPHPESPFVTGNEELVIFIGIENNLEIIGRHFTENTNLNHQSIKNLSDLREFIHRVGFPKHGIILKSNDSNYSEKIFKDFKNFISLETKVLKVLDEGKIVNAETDMRAMNNPTRMKAIERAVKNLAENIKSLCPECNAPGFSIIEAIRGLPCELCNIPTNGIKGYKFCCKKCKFYREEENCSKTFQDPTFCDYCNP